MLVSTAKPNRNRQYWPQRTWNCNNSKIWFITSIMCSTTGFSEPGS